MQLVKLFVVFIGLVAYSQAQSNNIEEDIDLNAIQLISKYGYQGEEHQVETDDGYIITLHRILPAKGSNSAGKSPVLLQHGLLCSSDDWIVMGPNYGLGYILSDAGYDVWMGNNRGNKYSRQHKFLDPDKDKAQFWDFSWHEMGVSDMPAMIDYVLSQTNSKALFYAGHSEGTTQFFVMGSKKPEYNSKIKLMAALAPVTYMGHVPSPLFQALAPFVYLIDEIGDLIGLHEFLPSSKFLRDAGELLCRDEAVTQFICSNVLFLMGGYDVQELNQTMLPVIVGHTPAGASTKNFLHYGQNVLYKKGFREYDYGTKANKEHYNQTTPPEYVLENVNAPVALVYSNNDWLSGVEDVENLWNRLPNVVIKLHVTHLGKKEFNHLDYLWAIHAPDLVYSKFLSLIHKYE